MPCGSSIAIEGQRVNEVLLLLYQSPAWAAIRISFCLLEEHQQRVNKTDDGTCVRAMVGVKSCDRQPTRKRKDFCQMRQVLLCFHDHTNKLKAPRTTSCFTTDNSFRMDDHRPPVLPTDLERVIFEIAARSRPQCIPRLILVAWRVKSWVEPLLYETIFLFPPAHYLKGQITRRNLIHSRDTLFPLLRSKPQAFWEYAARNLFLPLWDVDDGILIISHCRGVENLWMTTPSNEIVQELCSVVTALPLKKLHCHLVPLFGSPPQIDFSHQLFAQITHLGLFDYPSGGIVDPAIWSKISLIPNLTHLSLDPVFIGVCLTLFRACPFLRVLIVIGSFEYIVINHHADLGPPLKNDPRFVIMNLRQEARDWQIGTHGEMDYWAQAERFVAQRRLGGVDTVQCLFDLEEHDELNDEDHLCVNCHLKGWPLPSRSSWAEDGRGQCLRLLLPGSDAFPLKALLRTSP
ncbi:hypothetical protein MVEN_01536500 [Mycena venus]|uniref:Uncharacterized protein n=1 Tax=Mycena venus TaxID=2733690 RepID=A0A8H6XTF3_9AGAR|nr:hypothetical protein MVEN_01536500 [Mycena venus]